MTKKQKKILLRIILAAAMLVILAFIPTTGILRFGLYMIPYLVIGHDILRKAFLGIRNKRLFDENFLMAVATVGAIILAVTDTGDYLEAIAVMLFYQVGELFQSYAVGKSRRSIASLMDIRPDYANIEQDGQLLQVDPEEVPVGSVIVVQPGERVPLDGIVLSGTSALNTAALTGESLPRDVAPGDEIISGCIPPGNLTNPPWQRSWTWWKMPVPVSPSPRTSSPNLPGSIPPLSAAPPWLWRYCPPLWACCWVFPPQRFCKTDNPCENLPLKISWRVQVDDFSLHMLPVSAAEYRFIQKQPLPEGRGCFTVFIRRNNC